MKVFIDTGAFLAISDKSDTHHKTAVSAYQNIVDQKASLYTSNYVIDETITLIRVRVSHTAAVAFIKNFEVSNIKVLKVAEREERMAKKIFIRYKDKCFSFTDCTSFVFIEGHSLDTVLSIDEHFEQYGYSHHVKHLLLQ